MSFLEELFKVFKKKDENEVDLSERIEKVEKDLERVTFKDSCLNFGWGWRVEATFDKDGKHNGYTIFSGFNRPDTHTGKMDRGYGRPWLISLNYGDKELFMTCWMAIEQIIKHELLEAFSVDGARVFDPHKTMDDLCFPEVRESPKANEAKEKLKVLSKHPKAREIPRHNHPISNIPYVTVQGGVSPVSQAPSRPVKKVEKAKEKAKEKAGKVD